jgi:hypothetical protein
MLSVSERQIAEARAIEGHIVSGGDKIVPPPNWVWFARRCWPEKTAAHLATIAQRDERTAKRWLSGEFEPPNAVMSAIIAKLFEHGF